MANPSRYYSSNAAKTTLAVAISSGSTSIQLAAASNLPSQYPFTLVLEKDTANEEIITISGLVGGTTYTISERGVDGSGAKSHAVGATIEHGVSARDFTESRAHEVATSNIHGITGDFVGTGGAQTITGAKTFNAADITANANIKAGGFKITGLADGTANTDAVTKQQVDAIAGSATAAASSATAAATSATAAANSATAAGTSATNAAASATAAAASAATAATSAGTATTQAASAAVSASSAATSATAAANSATTAATSAGTATTQAGLAASSASSAASSATASATSAGLAATSALNAATSASSADLSYQSTVGQVGAGIVRDMGSIAETDTTAGTYINISTVAASAATSASSAATSASSAAASATTAAASAATATTSAGQAATSASSAAISASSAATSATNAAASAAAAAGYIPTISAGVNGYFLTNNGTVASWANLSDWGTL